MQAARRIRAIAIKELKEIFRSPIFLLLAYFVPIVLFIIFGFGLSLDVERIPTAIIDLDKSVLSRDLANAFIKTKYFRLAKKVKRPDELYPLLKSGEIRLGIVIPPDFGRRLHQDISSEVQLLIDGTYPYRATVIKGYTRAVLGAFNHQLAREWLMERGWAKVELRPVEMEVRFLYNEALKSFYALIPGLLVVVLMMNPAIMAALAIVKEKDYGTIYNIYASPIARWELLVGKLMPYYGISATNILILFFVSLLLFSVPFKGSFFLFLVGSLLYIFTTSGIGLLISIFTRSMVAAQIITIIVTVIPAFLYSGLLMPVSNLGREGEIEAHLFPAMYYMNIVQGTFSKVIGLRALWFSYLALIIYGAILFSLSLILFKKREG